MLSRRATLKTAAAASLLPTALFGRAAAQSAFEKTQGVSYGTIDGQELLLDLYQPPARETPRPAVVLIHGGYWALGDPSFMDWPASELATEGYVCFSIDHRLLNVDDPEHPNRWPAQLDDAQRAVRWIRANAATYGVDPERIGVIGHSSGGHLAAFLGTRDTRDNSDPKLAGFSSRVACVINLAGENDLTAPSLNPNDEKVYVSLLGGTREDRPDAYRDASPTVFVDEQSAPFLLLAGAWDEPRAIEQTWQMAEALRDAGVEVICGHLPTNHFDIVSWTKSGALTSAFLRQHLHLEQ